MSGFCKKRDLRLARPKHLCSLVLAGLGFWEFPFSFFLPPRGWFAPRPPVGKRKRVKQTRSYQYNAKAVDGKC